MLALEKFFDEHTMSVHLRVGTYPYGKKGHPGEWSLEKLEEEIMDNARLQEIVDEIIEKTEEDERSFIET